MARSLLGCRAPCLAAALAALIGELAARVDALEAWRVAAAALAVVARDPCLRLADVGHAYACRSRRGRTHWQWHEGHVAGA